MFSQFKALLKGVDSESTKDFLLTNQASIAFFFSRSDVSVSKTYHRVQSYLPMRTAHNPTNKG
jgi:hypothetical protein